jgi:hypothetical protein
MKKHAYLIMAHNNFYVLEKLLCLIDDERNDIYIHIDKKVEKFDFNYFKALLKKSKIFFINRINVNWGGFSQVKCWMLLLKSAIENRYEYYHLLSGVDLPLKTQDYIHTFFDVNAGKEFIGFDPEVGLYRKRVKYIYIFNESRSSTKIISELKRQIRRSFVGAQILLRYDRTNKFSYEMKKGQLWCSISHALAEFLIDNDENINNLFKYSTSSDECFIQTIAFNSNFRGKIYDMNDEYASCMRYIDWNRGDRNRGHPYIFRKRDYEELINSDKLFARKFDENIDKEIVDMIYGYLLLLDHEADQD